MHLTLWQVDAFAEKPLQGNPAAVIPLESWLDTPLMQAIALENNLSETAFFVRRAHSQYQLRWFTPLQEVDLCGHATLASAWVIFHALEPEAKELSFETRSGTLTVTRGADGKNVVSLPNRDFAGFMAPQLVLDGIAEALSVPPPMQVHLGQFVMAVWDDPKHVRGMTLGNLEPVLTHLRNWGFIATAPGDEGYDFISRFFTVGQGIPEDPVTGAAHTMLTPYWARRLNRKTLKARQVSSRGGDLVCTDEGTRTLLAGSCALYMKGEITL